MAKQPDDLVLRILNDIQATQADHSKQFEEIQLQLEELHDGMITSLGLASHAHVRHDSSRRRSMTNKECNKRLEAKR